MKKVLLSWILILCGGLVFGAHNYALPDPKLTPGKVNPVLTKDLICSSTFRTGKYRDVPLSEKKAIMKAYGYPWSEHVKYEFDHLDPIETGGSNDQKNIWPQVWAEARVKDKLENRIHELICSDQVNYQQVQYEIAHDWVGTYQRYIGPLP